LKSRRCSTLKFRGAVKGSGKPAARKGEKASVFIQSVAAMRQQHEETCRVNRGASPAKFTGAQWPNVPNSFACSSSSLACLSHCKHSAATMQPASIGSRHATPCLDQLLLLDLTAIFKCLDLTAIWTLSFKFCTGYSEIWTNFCSVIVDRVCTCDVCKKLACFCGP